MITTMPVPPAAGRAACAEPEHLPLVDAAMAKPGGPDGKRMAKELCLHCPVRDLCHDWAMTHAEIGMWAGTSKNKRTREGAPTVLPSVDHSPAKPAREIITRRPIGKREPNVADIRLAALGVRGSEVKRWAYERGLRRGLKGRVSLAHVEAYAAAMQQDVA